MATRKQLENEAKKYGATLEIDLKYGRYEIWLEDGKKWMSNGCQMYVVDYGYKGDAASAYDELIEAMQWGGVL
jgi:hypothetical protein